MSKDWTQEKAFEVLEGEITRLTAENEALANDRDGYVQLLTDQNNALTAENERLRTERSNLLGSARHQEARADALTALRAEVERLVKSRNRWGQKYNKLLNAVRTENAFGVYSEARDEYRQTITKLAAENEKLRNDVRLAVMSDSKECTLLTEENAALTARVEELEGALREIEYLDRPQSRGKPLRVSIQEIARAALQQPAEENNNE